MTTIEITAELIRDYLDRQLDPAREQVLEEAMLADPAIAEQIRAEMALRRGFKELARREGAQPKAARTETDANLPQVDNVTPFRKRG